MFPIPVLEGTPLSTLKGYQLCEVFGSEDQGFRGPGSTILADGPG